MIWLGLSLQLAASPAPPPPGGPVASLACADFRRQGDGTWSPVRPVKVGGMTVTPAMSFSPGVRFGGVDAAAVLDARCRSPRTR